MRLAQPMSITNSIYLFVIIAMPIDHAYYVVSDQPHLYDHVCSADAK